MPRGDGTGPGGMGPMTGRGAGYCAGYSVPGFMNPMGGRGFYGRGSGRVGYGFGGRGSGGGYRNWYRMTGMHGWQRFNMGMPAWGTYPQQYSQYTPQMNPQQESDMLKQEAKYLEEELNAIKQRLKDLGYI